MPDFCCAIGCENRGSKTTNISFHRFPQNDAILLKKWLIKLRRADFYPKLHTTVCSEHFSEDDFYYQNYTNRRFLKSSAIPSKFKYMLEEKKRYTRKRKESKQDETSETKQLNCDTNSTEVATEGTEVLLELAMNERFYSPDYIETIRNSSSYKLQDTSKDCKKFPNYSFPAVQDSVEEPADLPDSNISVMENKLTSQILQRESKKYLFKAETEALEAKESYYTTKSFLFLQSNKSKFCNEIQFSTKNQQFFKHLKKQILQIKFTAKRKESYLQQKLLEAELIAANSERDYYETKKALIAYSEIS